MKNLISFLLVFIVYSNGFSQIKKYGEISKKDFKIDSKYDDADAYVIFKNRETKLEFQNMEGWTLVTTIHERIKINSKGFDNATKKIKYYIKNGAKKELIFINAATYNLSNGKVSTTKLPLKNVFNTKINDYWVSKDFTMPNLRENSIVEWKYTIKSDYVHRIEDVVFQYDIPIKYFKAKIEIIDHLKFKYLFTNKLNASINTEKGLVFSIKDVPALIKEPYVKNNEQYRAKVMFDVFASNFPNDIQRDYSKTWEDVANILFTHERFGKQIKKHNFYKDRLPDILKTSRNEKDSILAIFNFVKKKVVWNKHYGILTEKGVKKTLAEGSGNVAEINLLLVSMLQKSGLDADPVLLSSRQHPAPYFPTINGFNYVICSVLLNKERILLDASEQFSTINVLPFRALNSLGRMMDKKGNSTFIDLTPRIPSLIKQNINIKINESGQVFGNFRIIKTELEALKSRKKLNNLSQEALIGVFKKKYQDLKVEVVKINNLKKLDKPLVISAKFTSTKLETIGNKLIVSPLFFLQKKETVFKSTNREHLIDFGTSKKTITHISITIPENYKVQSVPENKNITLNNNEGVFSYSVKADKSKIVVKVILYLTKPIIKTEDYTDFRNMLLQIIQKEKEQIILIKK